MTPIHLAIARMKVADGSDLDELRASYPELDFVFDEIDSLRAAVDELFEENRDLLGRIADLEDADD